MSWEYKQTISPPTSNTYDFGGQCSISENGLYMAIGNKDDNESGATTGYGAVYEYNGSWVQRGTNLTHSGQSNLSYSQDLSIDNTGTTVIISNIASHSAAGELRIWKWSGTSWSIFQTITESGKTRFGARCYLSSDGLAFTTTDTAIQDIVYYRFDSSINAYVKKADVPSTTTNINHHLTQDGLCVVVGDGGKSSASSNGVYEYNVSTNTWTQKGNTIQSTANGDYSHRRSICENKNICALGGLFRTRIFEYDSSTQLWVQKGSDLPGITNGYKNLAHAVPTYFNSTGTQFVLLRSLYEWDGTTNDWVVINTLHGTYEVLGMNVDANVIALSNSSAVPNYPNTSTAYTVDVWMISEISYKFKVQNNSAGQPVWAVYNTTDSAWYNQTELSFVSTKKYVFDVSDPSNNGYVLSFGTIIDVSDATIESTYVTRSDTPGTTNASVTLDLTSYTGYALVYFEDSSAGMGYVPNIPVDISYSFSVQNNVFGEPVWAIYDMSNSAWYNQPDMSFNAPYAYEFDVSDPSNNGYVLRFGTTVDVLDTTVESTHVTRINLPGTTDAKVLLDLRNYTGDELVYFEDSSAGMGYVEHAVETAVTYSDPNNPYNPDNNSREFYDSTNNNKSQLDTTLTVDSWKANGPWSNYTGTYMGAYMQINLTTDTDIAGVITQGSPYYNRWCTSYRFRYSTDNTNFYDIDGRTSWEGNSDGSTWHYNYFASTLTARYVRIYPLTFQGGPYMRAGLFLGQIGGITNDYAVTVSNEVFYIDGSANPQFDFSANTTYVFDQSDPTNSGQQIVFGFTDNDRSNILSSTDGVTIMGTPGQSGAYTQLDLSSDFVGPLYYYSLYSPVDISYVVTAANGKYYLNGSESPQIEFAADTTYYFDESDSSNDGHELMFGRTVDNVTDFLGSSDGVEVFGTAGQPGAYTKLVLSSSFTGMIYYYCANHSGMGYTPTYNVLDTTTVTNAVSGDTATLTAVSTDDLTDTTVVGTTNASKRDYTKNLITQLISDNSSALSGKKLVLSGITLPGFSNVKNRDTIVVSANTNSSLNNSITKVEITNKNVYLIIEDNETFTFPTNNSTLTVTKTGDTTYDASFSGVSTSYSSGDTFTQDGLTVVIGSVYATLEGEVGNVDILLTHFLNESITASGLDIPDFTETMTADATVTCTGPAATVLQNTFYFQTNNDIATSETDDVYYFVDTSQWSTMATDLNASTNGTISTADGAFIQGESISEYFLRHTANELFGTHLAVDLFNNETAVKSDITSKTAIVATNIVTAISNVGITGTDSDLSGAAYSKYLNDDVITSKNVSRELMNQLLDNDSSRGRFLDLSGIEMTPGVPGTYKIPFLAGDTLSYKVTIRPNVNQDSDVPTGGTTSERSFRVKMVLQ